MTAHENLLRTRPLLALSLPVLGIAAAAGLAAWTSSDALDTVLGMVAGVLTVIVLALIIALVWRARHPVASRPDEGTAHADRAALDALEPLRAARDDR